MDRKRLVWIGAFVGGALGSYIPSLWSTGLFSMTSLFLSAIGSFVGIYLGWKLGE